MSEINLEKEPRTESWEEGVKEIDSGKLDVTNAKNSDRIPLAGQSSKIFATGRREISRNCRFF